MSDREPKPVNKYVEFLDRRQPISYAASNGACQEGVQTAGTWGDYMIENVMATASKNGPLPAVAVAAV